MHIIMDPIGTLGEAFEVRSLCVHSVLWAANPHLLNASIHYFHSQHLDTQNQWPSILTTFWDTGLRSTDIKLPWNLSQRQPLMHRRQICGCRPLLSLLLCKTTFYYPPLWCKAKLLQTHIPLDRCSLPLLYAHQSKVRTPQISHHSSTSPSITIASRDYTATPQNTGAAEEKLATS
jgi:hypothetical protein